MAKKITNHLGCLLLMFSMGINNQVFAQNVGIGSSTPQNKLDVAGTFRSQGAVTFQSQTLSAANVISVPLTGETSLMVSPTAGVQANVVTFSAGTPQEGQLFLVTNEDNDPINVDGKFVGPGKGCIFIYQNGQWRPLSEPPGTSNDWTLTGNGATTPGVGAGQNFLGTTDLRDMVIATNSADRIHVTATGRVGINQVAPQTRFHVESAETAHIAIFDNNTANGDGIKIRLEGIHPLWNGTNYDTLSTISDPTTVALQPAINMISNLIATGGTLNTSDPMAVGSALNVNSLFTNGACAMASSVIGQINSNPFTLPLPNINIDLPSFNFDIPGLSIDPPAFTFNPPSFTFDPPAFTFNPPSYTFDPPAFTFDPPAFTFNPPSFTIDPPNLSVNPPSFSMQLCEPTGIFACFSISINVPAFNVNIPSFSINPPSYSFDIPALTINPPAFTFDPPQYSFDIPALTIDPPQYSFDMPAFNFDPPGVPLDLPNFPFDIPDITFPQMPLGNCSSTPSALDFLDPGTVVANSLGSSYEYITFVDKDDRWCGAVRAMNPDDFMESRLSTCALYETLSSFLSLDPVDLMVSAKVEQVCQIENYNNMGVSYESGHGDYAEWLEREDPKEAINYGEIVAIRGGKISKDLTNAEQIMVVSKAPIVLGNSPDPQTKHLGNMVAFIGQVPVKIMGPVKSGDFIVADLKNKGWGVAISPQKMTADDFQYAVGRSWDSNSATGFKFANTLVGMHNNAWISSFKNMQERMSVMEASNTETENRLKALENALNLNAKR